MVLWSLPMASETVMSRSLPRASGTVNVVAIVLQDSRKGRDLSYRRRSVAWAQEAFIILFPRWLRGWSVSHEVREGGNEMPLIGSPRMSRPGSKTSLRTCSVQYQHENLGIEAIAMCKILASRFMRRGSVRGFYRRNASRRRGHDVEQP